ncbi:hypothetical protein AAFF_G00352600 [Aldrovandia affinis]|uniref:Uncharacterized protein n=1 Tax=Aldrovandia affinis TaxID=143900 RepID=A0AAD7SJN4_9TELE|nr:hypothetical protein AAFF_G00352600 [Aldrovandia affinis]
MRKCPWVRAFLIVCSSNGLETRKAGECQTGTDGGSDPLRPDGNTVARCRGSPRAEGRDPSAPAQSDLSPFVSPPAFRQTPHGPRAFLSVEHELVTADRPLFQGPSARAVPRCCLNP